MRSVAVTLAALMLGAAPAAFAQPADPYGQGYPSYQGAAPSDQPPPPPGPNARPPGYPDQGYQGQGYQGQGYQGQDYRDRSYGQSSDDYQAELRRYRREKREYDRQRAAYDAQFGGGASAGAYAPPPPEPPAPPAAWNGGNSHGDGYYRYSETMPFRDGPWNAGDRGGYWYRERGCRLATPRDVSGGDAGRYVPVCPDADGRYRPAA